MMAVPEWHRRATHTDRRRRDRRLRLRAGVAEPSEIRRANRSFGQALRDSGKRGLRNMSADMRVRWGQQSTEPNPDLHRPGVSEIARIADSFVAALAAVDSPI